MRILRLTSPHLDQPQLLASKLAALVEGQGDGFAI